MSGLELVGVRVQNLRLFTDTSLDLSNANTYLIGPNNSGKTSLLALLDLAFNRDLTQDFARATDDLFELLMPARHTRNQARRLTLRVRIDDARRHKRFSCKNGIAELRLSLTRSDKRFRANLGGPRQNEAHDPEAVFLLTELRDQYDFVHIPAGRSVEAISFEASLNEALKTALLNVFQQPGKGATAEERKVKKLIDDELETISQPAHDFWADFLTRLPAGWVKDGSAKHRIDRPGLAGIIVDQLAVGISTGAHDSDGVEPGDVGSGLQSLLDIELRRYIAEQRGRSIILAIEEPEVFLHPSAQRRLGRDLGRGKKLSKLIVSTHSPLVVEEAAYRSIALVRDQRVHQPVERDEKRCAVNSFLAIGRGAEMYFARSVLFVEGAGDREFWEGLRRRLAAHDDTGGADHCYVVETGSNQQFAPWVRLIRSFDGSPIRWLALMDCDSSTELERCARDAGVTLSARQRTQLADVRKSWSDGDTAKSLLAARRFSTRVKDESRLWLAQGDLEQVMCSQMSATTVGEINTEVGLRSLDKAALAEDLGSNCRPGHKSKADPMKAPWIRRLIAEKLPGDEISPFAASVLAEWLFLANDQSNSSQRAVRQLRRT